MGAQVTSVAPAAHMLELADGHRFVYDKLVSTLPLAATKSLAARDTPNHVRGDEFLRYWLSEHDIEVLDRPIQAYYGDPDEFAAGKRIAAQVGHALQEKFGRAKHAKGAGMRLFQPRLVERSASPSMP